MTKKTASDIIPDVPLDANVEPAKTRLFENFMILRDTLKPGAGITGTFTAAGHTLTITNGVITGIT